MSCEFTEKISLLIDGELNEREAKEATAHLAACRICQRAHEDFLRVSHRIKSYAPATDAVAQRRALLKIMATEKPPFWRRSVPLPAPVFALMLIGLAALGVWVASMRRAAPPPAAGNKPGRVLTVPAPDTKDKATDLARFDRGGRAAIYKVRRAEQDQTGQ